MNDAELHRRFPDLQGSQAALLRAAARARELAEKTGTQLVVASRAQATAPKTTVTEKQR